MTYRSPGDALRRICRGQKNVVLVAPYMKVSALDRVLSVVDANAQVVCITRWTPDDIAEGVSDIGCCALVRKANGVFMLHPSLHAKYYRAGQTVLVGSANLTSAGLGWAAASNLEVLCSPGPDFDREQFEHNVLSCSREITDKELSYWEAVWEQMKDKGESLVSQKDRRTLSGWIPTTRDPRHLEVVYTGKRGEIVSKDERRAAQRDTARLALPDNLSGLQFRSWVWTSLWRSAFVSKVGEHTGEDRQSVYGLLAHSFGLSLTDARRGMETVESWLAFFDPDREIG